ncbi:hypothetical protein SLOPH_1037 [Spraguea lophii 42_110]|uniref:Uncharacterized protein n=1 Tax=Spraguea lophii (strain 42_110) TaxID=1358809 RepID=S7XS43_SPRLO|nr:hypothetical protein SLOPH_1037 [Spraguea lophii 42_110]
MLLPKYYTSSLNCSFIFPLLQNTTTNYYIIIPSSLNHPLSLGNIEKYLTTGNITNTTLSQKLKEKEIIKINNIQYTVIVDNAECNNIDNKQIVAIFTDKEYNRDVNIPVFSFNINNSNIMQIKEYGQHTEEIIQKIEEYINKL